MPRLAAIHFDNCFNMSVEVLHTVAPHADYATGYMNYNFFTAGAAYPKVFERLRAGRHRQRRAARPLVRRREPRRARGQGQPPHGRRRGAAVAHAADRRADRRSVRRAPGRPAHAAAGPRRRGGAHHACHPRGPAVRLRAASGARGAGRDDRHPQLRRRAAPLRLRPAQGAPRRRGAGAGAGGHQAIWRPRRALDRPRRDLGFLASRRWR